MPANGHTAVKQDSQPADIKGRSHAMNNEEVLMGTVVIRCPATGSTIPTGITADRLKFACSPVFFADAYCPACDTLHRWFAREAWVEEPRSQAAQAA
jgi:hypothetical protein